MTTRRAKTTMSQPDQLELLARTHNSLRAMLTVSVGPAFALRCEELFARQWPHVLAVAVRHDTYGLRMAVACGDADRLMPGGDLGYTAAPWPSTTLPEEVRDAVDDFVEATLDLSELFQEAIPFATTLMVLRDRAEGEIRALVVDASVYFNDFFSKKAEIFFTPGER